MKRVLSAVRVVVLGSLGAGLFFAGWHLWLDHKALHILFAIESARQQSQKPEGK